MTKSLSWLKAQNAQGCDIWIRPNDPSWVLLDDINGKTVDRLRDEGFPPSAVIETSPGNLQAWVKVADDLDPKAGTQIAKAMAEHFKADPASADFRHFGRLAGYTNRKPEHSNSGQFPYVRVVDAEFTGVVPRGPSIVDAARNSAVIAAKTAPRTRTTPVTGRTTLDSDAQDYFERAARILRRNPPTKPNGEINWSSVDYRVSLDMIKKGHPPKAVIETIKGSPGLSQRKHGHELDYVLRTVQNAAKAVYGETPAEEERDRGRER